MAHCCATRHATRQGSGTIRARFPTVNSVAGDVEPSAAKNSFDVILASVPADKKIAVIKAVREIRAGMGLAEAKALVECAPKTLLERTSKAEGDLAKKLMEDAGARIEIRPQANAVLVEEASQFDVVLASVPADKKIATIKAIREVRPGLGLAEAKAIVESTPRHIL